MQTKAKIWKKEIDESTIAILFIIFLGAILRFYNFDKNSLWLDEIWKYTTLQKIILIWTPSKSYLLY